ncbi:MAG: ParB N-terminal domain-containing protein, partial [Mycoplasmataceae bacterium]|nr:ParB N-terminal domain-containing protein [Mycoplasmataceae bacterium]
EDIIPYENNPRHNENAVDYVANSIKEFGFKVPIIIDKENVVVTGHTRLKASEKLGIKKVPVIMASDLTEEQIKAFRIADNKVAQFSSWDMEKLELELEDINIDMCEFGFEDLNMVIEDNEQIDETTDTHFNYKEQFGVIVMCKNEEEQEQIYNRLTEEGYECKVVAV